MRALHKKFFLSTLLNIISVTSRIILFLIIVYNIIKVEHNNLFITKSIIYIYYMDYEVNGLHFDCKS